MMPTWTRPATIVFSPGPWPCTSADGLSTRRYSAGRLNSLPSSKRISSRFSVFFRRSSTGQGVLVFKARCSPVADRRQPLGGDLILPQGARLVDQHDRNAVADRVREPRLLADQLLRRAVIAQRALGQGTNQDFQQFRIDVRGFVHAVLRALRLPIARAGQCRDAPLSSDEKPWFGLTAAISTSAINS